MQPRRASYGRPSGTDGSDFSYRMVVDSRYTKVAKGKSRLKTLIAAQTISQVIGSLWAFFSASQEKGLNNLAVLSSSIGFISLVIGELGRRRSQVILLILYTTLSAIATASSVAFMIYGDMFFKVIQFQNVSHIANYKLVEVALVLFDLLLQIFVTITTIALVQNMSPPKRSS